VITGGELSLDMLDLVYNPTARTYQAPLQLKSTGGVFIVDDLGRQEEPPQALINRWIVPLERARTSSPCNRARSSRCPSTRW
jgi:predicted ATPase with chaperone activity